jgi:DNA-directed RNA polymerase subunit RPC12/RpoP
MTPSFKPWYHCWGSAFFHQLLWTWTLHWNPIILPFTLNFCLSPVNDILDRAASLEKKLYTTHCRDCGSLTKVLYTVWIYGLICQNCQQEFIFRDIGSDKKASVKESKIKTEVNCPHCNFLLKKPKLKLTQRYPVAVGYKCYSSRLEEGCVPLNNRPLAKFFIWYNREF